jgi:leucine efflux protein
MMIYGITDITTFVVGTVFIVLLPGPNSLYVMTIASRSGVGAGYRGAFGIFVGDLILMLLSASGVASVLQTFPAVFLIFKYAGAAYLVWLGIGLVRSGWAGWQSANAVNVPTLPEPAVDTSNPFRTALVISLMNPKAILFFVSFFIQFVSPEYPHPALSFLILGVIVQILSLAYLSALIVGGARLAEYFRRRQRLGAAATGSVGCLFIGFSVQLAGSTLSS